MMKSLADGLVWIMEHQNRAWTSPHLHDRRALHEAILAFERDVLPPVEVTGPMMIGLHQIKSYSHAYFNTPTHLPTAIGRVVTDYERAFRNFAAACERAMVDERVVRHHPNFDASPQRNPVGLSRA